MSTIHPTPFLRNVLLLDAAASGATAALLIAGAGLLEGLLGLPVALMREAGLILVPYVAFVAWVGTRESVARGAVWAIVAANALWAVASVCLLLSGLVAPTVLGLPSSWRRLPSWRCWASCSTSASSGPRRLPRELSMEPERPRAGLITAWGRFSMHRLLQAVRRRERAPSDGCSQSGFALRSRSTEAFCCSSSSVTLSPLT